MCSYIKGSFLCEPLRAAYPIVDVASGLSCKRGMRVADFHPRFTNFLYGIGALRSLIQKANKDGSLIEATVAYAALVDGFLRIGLILKRQLMNKSTNVDLALISQTSPTQYLPERAVYKLALDENVIEKALFDEITELYDKRNAIVHRFLLTSQAYDQIPPTLEQYEVVYKKLAAVVSSLEEEEIKSGVGMTRALDGKNDSSGQRRQIMGDIMKRIIRDKTN
jgi:hypothetical protein